MMTKLQRKYRNVVKICDIMTAVTINDILYCYISYIFKFLILTKIRLVLKTRCSQIVSSHSLASALLI